MARPPAHQSHQIPLGIAEEHHPQIMILHPGDEVGFVFKGHAFFFHSGVRALNVGHGKVQSGPRMIELRLLGPGQHQAHSAAVEKRESWRGFEQQLQSQDILIKGSRPVDVLRVDGDLSHTRNSNSRSGIHRD
jgi:hypothetical protein